MKTALNFKNLFLPNNHYKWERPYSILSFWQSSQQAEDLQTPSMSGTNRSVKRNSESSTSAKLKKLLHRAGDVLAVQVDAHLAQSKLTWKAFCRVLLGVLLFGFCAPLAETAYTWLDKNDTVPAKVWYYESYFMLFLCLGPFIDKILTVTGLYLVFVHKKTKLLSYLAAWPIGLALAKIIWLLQVTSHAEFHSITPYWYVAYGVLLSVAYIFLLNYLVWFKYHRKDAIEPRLENLVKVAYALPSDTFRDSVVKTWKNKENVDQLNSTVIQ